jgi:hypothetical protein
MERKGSNTWLVAIVASAVGFLAAFLLFRDTGDTNATVGTTNSSATEAGASTTATNGQTTTTTTSSPAATPGSPQATVGSCVGLWNQSKNRGNQTFLVNLMSQQPVRVHVGVTTDVPPECLVTVVANEGKAYVFPEGGGDTYPYALAPGATDGSSLPAAQKTSNALEQGDGTLKER